MSAPCEKNDDTFFGKLSKFCTEKVKDILCPFMSSFFSRAAKSTEMIKHANVKFVNREVGML